MLWVFLFGAPVVAFWGVALLPRGRPALYGFMGIAALVALYGVPTVIDDQAHGSLVQGAMTLFVEVVAGMAVLAGVMQLLRPVLPPKPWAYPALASAAFVCAYGTLSYLIWTA